MRWLPVALLMVGAMPASAQTYADKREIVARGARECTIRQDKSATRPDLDYSRVVFRVQRSGAVGMAVRGNLYPGSRIYLLAGGRRSVSAPGQMLMVPAASLAALQRGDEFHASWRNWPYNREINYRDGFAGFAAAYQECRAYLARPVGSR